MAKERTEQVFVAVFWVAAGTPRVCMVERMLCNNRVFVGFFALLFNIWSLLLFFPVLSITRSDPHYPPILHPGYPSNSSFPEVKLPCTGRWRIETSGTWGLSPALLFSCCISGENSHRSALRNWTFQCRGEWYNQRLAISPIIQGWEPCSMNLQLIYSLPECP